MEVECGFLTYHPPMPHFPTIVRYKGQWMPEALITHGGNKRFTDAELAAECWLQFAELFYFIKDSKPLVKGKHDRRATISRFAESPNYDETE